MKGSLETLLLWPLTAFVLATGALVLFKMLTGKIRTKGLLTDPQTGHVSALRVQTLIATLAAASSYAAAIKSQVDVRGLPPVSTELVLLVAGSNGLLLANRGTRHLLRLLRAATYSDKDL